MKRTLILVRHAKAEKPSLGKEDFQRELSERGHKDAHSMATLLLQKNILPRQIISSPALRTQQTAQHLSDVLGYPKTEIIWDEGLYLCSSNYWEQSIQLIDDQHTTVFMVGHNPGITDFVNTLSPSRFSVSNIPTCGITGIHSDAANWVDFFTEKKNVFLYEYPKKQYDQL